MYGNVDEFIMNKLSLRLRSLELIFCCEITGIKKKQVVVKVTMSFKACETEFYFGVDYVEPKVEGRSFQGDIAMFSREALWSAAALYRFVFVANRRQQKKMCGSRINCLCGRPRGNGKIYTEATKLTEEAENTCSQVFSANFDLSYLRCLFVEKF